MPEPGVPLIPLRHFFDNPERAGVQISPDGSRLSYLAPEEGRLNVWVRSIEEDDAVCVTHDHTRGIPGYLWSRDGKRILYVQDQGGNENYHLYAADVANPEADAVDLTPFENVRVGLVDNPRATPTKLLIAMNRRNPQAFDVHRIDIESGDLEPVAENPGDIVGWQTDAAGRVRGALAQTPAGGWQLRVRDDEDSPWRVLADFSNEDDCAPYGFTPDGTGLWIGTAKDAEFHRLLRIDAATGETSLVDEHPAADLVAAVISDKTKDLVGTAYVQDEVIFHGLEQSWQQTWDRLKSVHAGDPSITGMDEDERNVIVTYDDDRDPGATYAFDRATGKATFLWRSRPWLDPEHLAPMQPVSFPARGGLTLHAYLTTPVGVEPANLPMVLLVHGGPWSRDAWGYDPEAQFLANRGYAVLQVNYRGSTGYGKSFKEAAVHEWAGAMHHDLIDAVGWAVERGTADPAKVAIYGGSYGGYATLVGLTFTPETFACGITYCGPSSLLTLVSSFPEYWKPILAGTFFKHVGNPENEAEAQDMRARSPLFKIDAIKAPLMVAQGANDVRVTKQESDQVVEALRAKGIDVEYICKDDEGHGFANPENKMEFYGAMERFLARHLGGRTES
ncbi:MAG TPA: S9 family peptidase [Actinomycetota bacterium]